MQSFKIEYIMTVDEVGKTHVTVSNENISEVKLSGNSMCTLTGVHENSARCFAGRLFGKVRITIEPAE